MNIDICRSALEDFAGKRVMVIGDLMLDEHVWGTVERISPEAPVMVVRVDSHEPDCRPGGAANVANNIRALGAHAGVVGVVGDDEGGRMLVASLERAGIDVGGVFVDSHRPTTRKTRIWASHRHQVVRVDHETSRRVSPTVVRRMVEYMQREVGKTDSLLISDYDKGVITRETASTAIRAAGEGGKVSASNAKPHNMAYFRGVGVITLNQLEASAASGIDIHDVPSLEKAGRKIMNSAQCGGLVITRGAHGLSVFQSPDQVCHIPALETEVYDAAGAGDTAVSALILALSCGLDLASAGIIANCAGAAVVRKVGVATTSVEEIRPLLNSADAGKE